jgi:hypothetical protein
VTDGVRAVGRRGGVLRSRQMVLREPPGIDARLPAGLVLREADIARRPMERTQHQRTGVRGIAVVTLTDRSKELDARPAGPVLRGVILCTYSTGRAEIRNIIKGIANTFLLKLPGFFELQFRSDPRRALCVRAALTAPTYIRPGLTRSKVPHARCEGAGSKGDGTILYRGVFQPCRHPVTHPPWIS